jgi:hypothetical protein
LDLEVLVFLAYHRYLSDLLDLVLLNLVDLLDHLILVGRFDLEALEA